MIKEKDKMCSEKKDSTTLKVVLFIILMMIVVAAYCYVYLSEIYDKDRKIIPTKEIVFDVV